MRKGRPNNQAKEDAERAKTLKEEKKELFTNRYLFVKRPENLTPEERQKKEALITKHPVIGLIAACMMCIYILFDSKTYEEAQENYNRLLLSEFATNEYTKGMIAKIKGKFEKAFVHLRLKISERTINHVERQNRWFRKIQKSCNKLRRKKTIENRIDAQTQMNLERKRESEIAKVA